MPVENAWESTEVDVGAAVRRLRTERGWSQAQLGAKLKPYGFDLTQTTVAKLELGQRPIRLNEAAALADIFGMSTEQLVSGADAVPRVDILKAFADPRHQELIRETMQLRAEIDEVAREIEALEAEVALKAHALHAARTKYAARVTRLETVETAVRERTLDLAIDPGGLNQIVSENDVAARWAEQQAKERGWTGPEDGA